MAILSIMWWRLWFLRNQYVHGISAHDTDSVLAWLENFLTSFIAANAAEDVPRNVLGSRDVLWRPPLEGTYKVNSDVTIDKDQLGVGIGLVIRDFQELVMVLNA
ncbi:hypothetical protein Dsin_012087 [Dipteronia sinensis]|uniref:Uncharacterized protein n=1 Tax=Dipteronia sinensis TaxID=43782 RepID=A0AAE0AHF4_9ROSI|nr:hypothetical protein Dsin_012087 [Dipteronia sinensis]